MSKIANFSLEYYTGNLDKVKLYTNFFSECKIDFFINKDQFSYLIDYDPFYHKVEIGENISNFVLDLIENADCKPLTFSLILDEDILMSHTINAVKSEEINIAINSPKMLDLLMIPDFTFYAEKILPFFDCKNIKLMEFSY